jgi:putative acetyltransferase
MKVAHRPAAPGDAERLFEIRRRAIVALAPNGMPGAQVEAWAADLTIAGMERKLRELEIWIAALDGTAIGWGAIRGDRLEGLYTDPEHAGRGVATELLGLLEGLMRERGVAAVHADASANAETFYLRRGYVTAGAPTGEGARPITKRLS